jgi:hypothetical protein
MNLSKSRHTGRFLLLEFFKALKLALPTKINTGTFFTKYLELISNGIH